MLIAKQTSMKGTSTVMNTITYTQRYLPHEINTKYYAVKLYRTGVGVSFVCRRYHISKSSLMRWNKKYDGTKESLIDKSHKPHSTHPGSLYRVFRRLGYSSHALSTKKMSKPQPYDTPTELGIKWQMDVKYVPTVCYTGSVPQKFYQYTIIDEASRERFLYPYMEQSNYSTTDFVKKAIAHFGYKPEIIQTYNGSEFTHLKKTDRVHPFDVLCKELGIKHHKNVSNSRHNNTLHTTVVKQNKNLV
jgi:transposase InsO family protein